MQRARTTRSQLRHMGGLLVGASALCAPAMGFAQQGGSMLTGVVRDAEGVCQMGVLVQVLSPGFETVGSAFTDEHGRYRIGHLLPGRYRVRASAAMFVPATRSAWASAAAPQTVVNLTMSALFDTASWLHAQPRRVDEPADDWTWTLRSTADRPILRLAGQSQGAEEDTDRMEGRQRSRIQGQVRTGFVSGMLAGQGTQESVLIQRTRAADTVSLQMGLGPAGMVDANVRLDQKRAFAGSSTTTLQYVSQPALGIAGQPVGLQAVRFASVQQTALGDLAAFQAGGVVEAVRTSQTTLMAAHPFLKVIALPNGRWRVQYTLQTEAAPSAAENDLPEGREQGLSPVRSVLPAPDAQGIAKLENGRHQELAVEHDGDDARIEVAVFHDDSKGALLSGLGNPEALSMANLLTTQNSGQFAVMSNGFQTQGARVAWTAPIRNGLWVIAEYSIGSALSAKQSAGGASLGEALRGIQPATSQAALIAIRGSSRRTGTQVRASYRWQPVDNVTAVDAYSSLGSEAYFGLYVRQPLRMAQWLPSGLQATVDISNLLAQGYRPFVSLDGQTLYLAQTPRNLQVGLAFNF